MFDKLVITQPEAADFKNRKRYFIASGIGLSLTLSVAMVVSLFAISLDLGTDNFDMVELLAPVEMPQNEPPLPEPAPRPQQKLTAAPDTPVKVPTRQINMARVDEAPREIPTAVSTAQNTLKGAPG